MASRRARRTAASRTAGSGALGIDDAVDVAGPDVERRDPGRRVGRREDDEADAAAQRFVLRLAQLVAHDTAGNRAVLRLDHDAQVRAPR